MNDTFIPKKVAMPEVLHGDANEVSGGPSRRTFIKRTGGATAATLIAWNLQTQTSKAEGTQYHSFSVSAFCDVGEAV